MSLVNFKKTYMLPVDFKKRFMSPVDFKKSFMLPVVFLSPVADKKGPMSPVAKYPSEALVYQNLTFYKLCHLTLSSIMFTQKERNNVISTNNLLLPLGWYLCLLSVD
jgi:hypothetical protein